MAGARNSRKDQQSLQDAHDAIVRAGAMCSTAKSAKAQSLGETLSSVYEAFDKQCCQMSMSEPVPMPTMPYIEEVYPDFAIVEKDDKYYKAGYTTIGETVTFDPESAWVEVEEQKNWIPVKSTEMLISYGSAVKSINGKPGGYAVTFGGKDLTKDDFGDDTNYGFAGETTKKVDILFHHAQPLETKDGKSIQVAEPIGRATLKMADDGVLIDEAILFNADRYAKHLDRLGWSTGAAAHSVIRDDKGHIKQWQIAEVSLTPIPAEPRNMVSAKSLAGMQLDIDEQPEIKAVATESEATELAAKVAAKTMQLIQQRRQNAG